MLDKDKHALFCEGVDDKHVIAALLSQRFSPEPFPPDKAQTFIIKDAKPRPGDDGNFGAALNAFGAALENQRLQRIGLVVDRDSSKHKRIDQILARLARIDVDKLYRESAQEQRFKTELGDRGVIMNAPDGRKWGIWLMPDNRSEGNLETLIAGLPKTHSALWDHAVASTAAVGDIPGRFHATDEAKARLHAYLAWTNSPGRPFGDGIRAGHIGSKSPAVDAFVEWFKALFLEP